MPGGAVLAAVDPAAEQRLAATEFVECSLCKRLYPKGSCVDPDRKRVAGVNRKPRFKCKTCNSFAKTLSTTLAGHVGLRDQWEEKTAEEHAAWIDEQRLALQSFGHNVVVKELTQLFPSPRRWPRPQRRRSSSGSRGTGWTRRACSRGSIISLTPRRQSLPTPPSITSGIVFGCRACVRVLGVVCVVFNVWVFWCFVACLCVGV